MLTQLDLLYIVLINILFTSILVILAIVALKYQLDFIKDKISNTLKTLPARSSRAKKGTADKNILDYLVEYGPTLLDLRREGYTVNEILQLLQGKEVVKETASATPPTET